MVVSRVAKESVTGSVVSAKYPTWILALQDVDMPWEWTILLKDPSIIIIYYLSMCLDYVFTVRFGCAFSISFSIYLFISGPLAPRISGITSITNNLANTTHR